MSSGGETVALKLEVGMLLLAPPDDVKGPQVFAVADEDGLLVGLYNEFTMRVRRNGPGVPEGWVVLSGVGLAEYLSQHPDALNAASQQDGDES